MAINFRSKNLNSFITTKMQCDQNNLSHNEVFVELYDEAQLCSIDYERKKGENICNVEENPIHIIFAT